MGAVLTGIMGCSAAGAGFTSKVLPGIAASASNHVRLAVNATSVRFGTVAVSAAAAQQIILTSTGSAPLTVNAASISGNTFKVDSSALPAKLNPGQSLVLYLEFKPNVTGAATGQLTLDSTSDEGESLRVELSGVGKPNDMELSWNEPLASDDPVVRYNVYRAQSGSTQFELLGSSGGTTTTFTDSTVTSGAQYDYYITSQDNTGNESIPSPTISVEIP